ncbi:hypothetical protein FCP72_14875 [Salmonella enterica]|nr:hypothetical protein [Salmonella enterica]EBV9039756.1 hypothetical protein [Salmonella enterica subsp. enterica serovar Enteritidis]
MALRRRVYKSPVRRSASLFGKTFVAPRNNVAVSCNAAKIFRIRLPVLPFAALPAFATVAPANSRSEQWKNNAVSRLSN